MTSRLLWRPISESNRPAALLAIRSSKRFPTANLPGGCYTGVSGFAVTLQGIVNGGFDYRLPTPSLSGFFEPEKTRIFTDIGKLVDGSMILLQFKMLLGKVNTPRKF